MFSLYGKIQSVQSDSLLKNSNEAIRCCCLTLILGVKENCCYRPAEAGYSVGSSCPPEQRFNYEHCTCSRLCGSRVSHRELRRRGSVLVRPRMVEAAHLLYMRRLSHSTQLLSSCTLVGARYHHTAMPSWIDVPSTRGRPQGGESGTGTADESRKSTIGVVGPAATQGVSPHDCAALTRWGRGPIDVFACPLGGSASTVPVKVSTSKGDPRRGSKRCKFRSGA